MRRAGLVLAFVCWGSVASAVDLCVKTGGSDATAKASIVYVAGNEAGSTCWDTIGRAAWGSTNRAAPSGAAAAAAGDTVYVFAGTYDSGSDACLSGGSTCRHQVYWGPTNTGSSGSRITFACLGTCQLDSTLWNGPAIGANAVDGVKWYADISQGHQWRILPYAAPGTAPAGRWRASDVGDSSAAACISTDACWIEGMYIDAVEDSGNRTGNWPGILLNNSTGFMVRNNEIYRMIGDGADSPGVQIYDSNTGVIEHNFVSGSHNGVMVKDTGGPVLIFDNHIRLNLIRDAVTGVSGETGRCWGFSTTTNGPTYVYQNLCINPGSFCAYQTGGGADADVWANNTCVGASTAFFYLPTLQGNGSRIWNNVLVTSPIAYSISSAGDILADTEWDLEHNVYRSVSSEFLDNQGGGTQHATLALFQAHHADLDADSISSDPLFANAAGSDYRLCTAAGVPHASCTGASPAIALGVDLLDLDNDASTVDNIPAGAYVNADDVIGLATDGVAGNSGVTRLRFRTLN